MDKLRTMKTKREKIYRELVRATAQIDSSISGLEKCVLIVSVAYLNAKGIENQPKDNFGRTMFRILETKNEILKIVLPIVAKIIKDLPTKVYQEVVDLVNELDGSSVAMFIQQYLDTTFKRMYSGMTSSGNINDLLVKLANIKANDEILDPTCGIGGTLLAVVKNNPHQRIYGQDINSVCIAITEMILEINGSTDYHLFIGDTLSNPYYIQDENLKKFDVVITEPPFVSQFDKDLNKNDKYNRYSFGTVPLKKADWGFIMNAINSSKELSGRAIVLLPTGTLFRGGSENEIRQNILKNDLFEAIISLPGGLLAGTAVPTSVLIFNHDKSPDQKNKILFVKVPKESLVQEGKGTKLTDESIEKIVTTIQSFKEIKNYSMILPNNQVSTKNMMVERYIKKTVYNFDNQKYYINLIDFYNGNTIALKNVSKIDRGYNMVSKNENPEGKYWIMKISDIDSKSINYDKMSRGDVEGRTKVDNYELQDGDIVMTVRGIFKLLMAKNVKDKTLINSNLVRLRVNPKLYNPDFLKLFLDSPIGRAQLDSITVGTTVRQIPIKTLSEYQLPQLSLEEQEKVVHNYLQEINEIQSEMNKLQNLKKKNNQELYKKMGLEGLYQADGETDNDL
ncbi:hypothetical protein CPR19092_LGOLGGFK_01902 [Companilactobacillus paralimentarius]